MTTKTKAVLLRETFVDIYATFQFIRDREITDLLTLALFNFQLLLFDKGMSSDKIDIKGLQLIAEKIQDLIISNRQALETNKPASDSFFQFEYED